MHTHINVIQTPLGVLVINCRHSFRLGLEEILYVSILKRHNLDKYYFVTDSRLLQLDVKLPNTSKNKSQRM